MKNMKSIIAVLMCAAIVLGALYIVPGAVVNPVSAEGNGTNELKASYRFTFEDATDLNSLFDKGWVSLYGSSGVPKLFSIVELDGNKVLKYDNSSANPNALSSGSYGLATPMVKVTLGATVFAEAELCTEGSHTAMLYLYFYDANGNKLTDQAAGQKATNGAWGKNTQTKVAPADAAFARAMVYNGSSNNSVVYFDNIVIREQITTSSASNGFANGKATSVWNSIDIDFEQEHCVDGMRALGWTLAATNGFELVTEADGNHAFRMKSTAYSPLLDVRGLTAIQASMDLKTTTFVDLYVYFFDENGAATLATVDKRDTAASALGVQDGSKWLPYTSRTIALPAGTAYVMFMLYSQSTTDALVDNFKVINSYKNHDELVYNFENGETMTSLYQDGWYPNNLQNTTRAGTVVADGNNTVLKLQRTEKGGTIWLYSGYMNVANMSQLTVSADMMSTAGGLAQVYVYTYDANMTRTNLGLLQIENSQCDGQWHTLTKTLDLPDGAVYANFMLCNATYDPASYYDNIMLKGVAGGTTPTTTAPATTAPATTAPATTAPATTAPATTAPATTAPATTAPATTAPATTAPATTTAPAGTTAAADTTAPATTPDTGDNSGITAMFVVMILAVTAMAALVFGTKKRVF